MSGHDRKRDAEAGEPVLVSACLLGRRCRYDGGTNEDRPLIEDLAAAGKRAVAFCPEEQGGLSTPRPPAWIESGDAGVVLDGHARMTTDAGADVTAEFLRGADRALDACQREGIRRAYLKERSPSCGVACTHVAGRVTAGRGVTAERLARAGIELHGVEGRRSSRS